MDDPEFLTNALSVALGGGAGGVTAWAVLHMRLTAAEANIGKLESSLGTLSNALGTKHEANASRIAHLEAGHAATGATMAALTTSLARMEASIERLGERMAAFPNEVASMLGDRRRP